MQTSGEAVYVADVGTSTRELFAAPVESTRALAKLGKVDPAAALKLPGVVAFVGKPLSAVPVHLLSCVFLMGITTRWHRNHSASPPECKVKRCLDHYGLGTSLHGH